MANEAVRDDRFRRNERVVAVTDLPGVPDGSGGKVELVNGLTWIRYRVHFDNGVDIGSLDARVLARPKDADRRREAFANQAARADAAAGVDGDAEEVADVGETKTVNGVVVPARLLAMSKRARERLAS